jgi:hypothetical protein
MICAITFVVQTELIMEVIFRAGCDIRLLFTAVFVQVVTSDRYVSRQAVELVVLS